MSFIADLHTHSRFSRATSRECTLEGLHVWAQRKGIRVVGSGDFTHPEWFAELGAKLVPSAPGLFRLREPPQEIGSTVVPASCLSAVDMMLSGEVSSIYRRHGRVHKVHSLVLVPDLESAARIRTRLGAIGNIVSDGRPILGLDPRDLLEIVLEANEAACLIPAHIWTPWFSMLGSKSGFDSPEACFGDLVSHIFAVETGLSSDPPMNWRVPSLDGLTLISNSDLHSPGNLGRNATIFHCEVSYPAMMAALRMRDPAQFGGTIDMFPEEGKYHCDGHRACGVCFEPEESLVHNCICPVCGKPLVLGVLHRVVALAGRPQGYRPATAMPAEHSIALATLLSEIQGRGPATKTVRRTYEALLSRFGPELQILRQCPLEDLAAAEPPLLAEAVGRLRREQVIRRPGFDGQYGSIRVFEAGELD